MLIEPTKDDQAPSAILELIDGPKDMRFAMTAKTLARQREMAGTKEAKINELTQKNIDKVTRYRAGGAEALEDMVSRLRGLEVIERGEGGPKERRWGGVV